MTSGIWRFLRDGPDTHPIALRGGVPLTARDIRAEAARIRNVLADRSGPVFLYCEDSANFLAGLVGDCAVEREILLPGHAAPGYLREIGATGASLVTDVHGLDPDATQISVRPGATAIDDVPMPRSDARIGFFTSGSTGEPKPCPKTLAQLESEAGAQLTLWGAPAGPVIGTVSHQHIYGLLFRILWPLAAGRPFVAERHEMWEAIDRHMMEGAALVSSPAHLSRIPDGFSLARFAGLVFSSGGPLSAEAARDAAVKLGGFPVEVLGSTETGGVAWRRQDETPALWTPLPGVEIERDGLGALAVRSPYAGSAGFMAMGDRVVIEADGRFALQARLDRVVKIEGKRVSLPRVEDALRGLPDIVDAMAVDLPDRRGALGVAIVLAPEGRRVLAQMGRFRYSRQLRNVLADRLEPMERPRLWRFVDRIPENSQGKRTVADLRALFAALAPEIPTVTKSEIADDEAHFELELDPALRWFDGHFPGQPILPGVAQLHIASLLAERTWGLHATGREMSRIKFRRVMQPGDRITLTLVRGGAGRLDFRYMLGEEIMASGAFRGDE